MSGPFSFVPEDLLTDLVPSLYMNEEQFEEHRYNLRQVITNFLLNYKYSPYRSTLNPKNQLSLIGFIFQLSELLCHYNLSSNERDILLADVYEIILDITGEDYV